MNIIECTIKMKRETSDHYLRLAAAADTAELKQLFSLLAAAEQEHVHLLAGINAKLSGATGPTESLEEGVCVFRSTIDGGKLGEALQHDPDAFRHIVAEEEEAIDLFEHLADESESARMKRLCRILADQERKHLHMIEEIYHFVEEPRTYLEWVEFGNQHPL